MVICKGDAVTEVAKLRGVHRSAIYQHLARVRKAISPLMEEIEIQLRW
jgi:hypothetical protein